MHRIKSVGVLSVAKVMGITYGCIGLIIIPFALIGGLASVVSGQKEGEIGGVVFLLFAVLAPVFYGGMGFLTGALTAWLYNVTAKWTGGIELDLQPPQSAAFLAPPGNLIAT
jgi:hypothetical protein